MVDALRQSEANSQFLFAHNPLPMWVLEKETLQFLQVNDAAVRQYGYARPEFLQMRVSDLYPAELLPRLLAAVQDPSPRDALAGEFQLRKKDGSVIDVEMFLHGMEYLERSAALVVALDITDRKRAEEEKQKFFTLVENSRDFIAVADLQDNLEYVNPAGRAMLGIEDAGSVKGSRASDYVVLEDLPLVQGTVLPALYSQGHWQGELRFRHRKTGQTVQMDCLGFQVKDQKTGEPRYVAAVSRDMTERRALEQQLRHAQKFEAVGQLAGGIAHDFNNVIGAILGWAELGEDQAASSDATLAGYFNKIHAQCDRVSALVRQLLAFARRQVLEPQNLDVNSLINESISLMAKVIGEHVQIDLQLAKDLEPAWADASQVEQIIMNLCINARDAMPGGGKLTIATHMTEIKPGAEEYRSYFRPGRYILLTVADTGTGMDAATLEHIFEPFFTTKEVGKGTGLGLATVYGIVKQHNGIIDVESELGRGTKFHVYLPAGTGVVAAREKKPSGEVRRGTETILIAEDNDDLREAAREMIEALGYRVLLAHDGEEAVQLFTENANSVDLVLLDVVMPKLHGPAALEQMTALKPGLPTIFTTGYASEADSLASGGHHRVGVLHKPYGAIALGQKIRALLDARNP
jgi:PAS domain S-box-containing protein